MVVKAGKAKDIREARILWRETLDSGKALQVMKEWIVAQGGTAEEVEHPDLLPQALCQEAVCAERVDLLRKSIPKRLEGFVCCLTEAEPKRRSNRSVGRTCTSEKSRDPVHSGESLAILHANDREKAGRGKGKTFESV